MNWNMSLIYPTPEDWEKDFASIDEDIKVASALRGTLATKEGFEAYARMYEDIYTKLGKLYVYASMTSDLNQKNQENARRIARIGAKYAQFGQAISFVEPEILAAGKDTILSYCQGEYAHYQFHMEDLFRQNEHILSAQEEEIMANYQEACSGFNRMYSQLSTVDNSAVPVTLSDGTTIEVSSSNMTFYLGVTENPKDRTKIFEAVYAYYEKHKATYAAIYNGILKSEYASMKSRGYSSMVEARLSSENIPVSVYESLIETAKATSDCLKRYNEIRRKFFKLDKIRSYDRFLSMAESKKVYSYEEGRKLVLEAMDFMGSDFKKKAENCLADGRVSVEVTEGKRTGAYSTGTYPDGPFILLNHNGSLNDVFTIAHECGHSIHTSYANEAQKPVNAGYSLFVAEVASTFNEQRFLDYLMENCKDKDEKLILLQEAIQGITGTFYRQSLFAAFEYEAHKLVEMGKPVDYEALSDIMKHLYKDYYNMDLNDEDEKLKCYVWCYIPHFYNYPFYVYQYATSFSASLAIYDAVKNKVPGAFESYIELLKSGGSNYPVELLKKAGCDLTTPKPFMAVSKRMNELLDELESLINE